MDLNDDIVDDSAQAHGQQLQGEIPEQTAEGDLADDDGGQADDDGTTTHVDLRVGLILAQQSTGEGHQAVGQSQTQHLVHIGVDALRPGHVLIGTGGSDGRAPLGAEEPVQDGDDYHGDNAHYENGVIVERTGALVDLLEITQGHQQLVVVHVQSGVCLHAHGSQVHGPQPQLGENTGKDGGNAALGVEKAGDQAGHAAGQEGAEHGNPHAVAVYNHHNADHTAGAEGAVYGQVSQVKNPIGDVKTDGHNAPDQPLGHGTGQCVEKARHW